MKKISSLAKIYFSTTIIVFLISFTSIAQPANWTYVNTGQNHTILIQTTAIITVNGSTLDLGDYIGVFFEDNGSLYCAGYTEWDNTVAQAVTAWGNDTSSPIKDGFDSGEAFQWKIWDSSTNLVFSAVVTYISSFPHQGTYFHNGMSAIATAMSSSNIIPTITSPTCFGMSDGSIDLNITSGTGPYSFSWSNGATTQNITNLAAGNYSITVTDALAFSDSLIIQVSQPDDLAANILVNEDSAFMCMSHAEVFPTGGTTPYSYLWNTTPPQTSQLATLCPGLFNVTITDSNNCQTNVDVIVNASSQNVIDSAFTIIDTCLFTSMPDTAYISNLLYSSGTMIIEWTFEFGGNSITLNTYYPGITSPGLYYIGLVINCPTKSFPSLTFVAIYDIPQLLEISGVASDASCNGLYDGSIDILPAGGTPPYSYLWSTGETTEDINTLSVGNYSVTISDSNGSNAIATFIVSQPTIIEVSGAINNLICNSVCDGSINLTVTGGNSPYSFLWSNGQSNQNITNLCSDDYNVSITDSNGCSTSTTFELTEPGLLNLSETITDASCCCCNDGEIIITITGGVSPYTYQWSNGEVTEDISTLYSGIYEVTVTDSNGCELISELNVSGPNQLEITGLTENISCNGQSDGSITISVTGGTSPYLYSWSNGESSVNINTIYSGIYEVTVTDLSGCTLISEFEITQPNILSINGITNNASSFGSCDGNIDVTVLGGTIDYTYYWSNGEIIEDIENLCADTYILTVTDNNSCTDSITFTITEPSSLLHLNNAPFTCTIHPNPIENNLHLNIENTRSENLNLEIYNSLGSKIFDSIIDLNRANTFEVDLPSLPSGIYIAKIYNRNNQSTIIKFIKQ